MSHLVHWIETAIFDNCEKKFWHLNRSPQNRIHKAYPRLKKVLINQMNHNNYSIGWHVSFFNRGIRFLRTILWTRARIPEFLFIILKNCICYSLNAKNICLRNYLLMKREFNIAVYSNNIFVYIFYWISCIWAIVNSYIDWEQLNYDIRQLWHRIILLLHWMIVILLLQGTWFPATLYKNPPSTPTRTCTPCVSNYSSTIQFI